MRLNRAPEPGETIVLNVTFKDGDQSIRLEQNKLSTRFEFNESNWDKPAYMLFEVDHKLTKAATATFEGASGNIPFAWLVVFGVLSAFFFAVAAYHSWAFPHPAADGNRTAGRTAKSILKEFIETFKTFFQKDQIWVAIAFMLLYRLPEAQLVKLINPFLLDPVDMGGLGLTTGQVGIVYGTIGIIGLTIGGIERRPETLAVANGMEHVAHLPHVRLPQLCHGTVAADHQHLRVHRAIRLRIRFHGLHALPYILLGRQIQNRPLCHLHRLHGPRHDAARHGRRLAAGNNRPRHFFLWTMICCVATVGICAFLKIDPNFGRKIEEKN